MKCPQCNVDLTPAVRHRLKINTCPSCKGMWLEHPELEQLEDEVFDFGEHAKGTLVADLTATNHKCPECNTLLQRFRYRFYDLEMELCPNEHGYWLEESEDTRVLQIMKTEERDLKRKWRAEDQWAAMRRHMHSRSFLSKLRDLFQR